MAAGVFLLMMASLVFATRIVLRRWNRAKDRPIRLQVLLFLVCYLAAMGLLVTIVTGVVPASPKYYYYEYYQNGRYVGRGDTFKVGGSVQSNILATVLIGIPLGAVVVFMAAFGIAWVVKKMQGPKELPKLYPLKKGYAVWSAVNIGCYFLGLVPLYYTLRAQQAQTPEIYQNMLRKAKRWNMVLSILLVVLWGNILGAMMRFGAFG